MASIRSSLPSRLRQLLSSEGAIGPSIKLDSEPPSSIKAFVDKVIQCPLQDIAIPLSGFRWEYGKGNFHHWRPLFLHFDTYFKTYLSCRNDLLLSDEVLGDDSPFPTEAVLQILRVMQIILENCHNKTSFNGIEHFKLLLASTNPEILVAALEVLSALVKITPSKLHASGKLVGCGSVNTCLLSLAQGWGSKEEGLGLYSCITLHEGNRDDGLCLFPSEVETNCDKLQNQIGSSLYFELHGTSSPCLEDGTVSSGSSVIHLPDTQLRTEDDLSIMKFCIQHYNVPQELRFPLLTRVRYARALHSSRMCRLYSKICLLAFIVLVQSSDSHDELVSFFANEPEYTNELIRIVRSEENISGMIRTFAMIALGAQLAAYSASHERARILSGSSISFAGGNRMILLNVLQRAILSLKNSVDLSAVAFVEALLQFYLLHVISSSSTGSVVRGSGMVPTFLPLLEDSDPTHLHLVCLAVKTLQKLMDYSNTAVTLFRDLGGVEHFVNRLQIEVHRVIQSEGSKDNSMVIGENSICSNDQLYAQKRLVRALLKALGSATYATANSTRSQNSFDVSLTPILSMIFINKEKFGGEIYSSAVALMSEMIHKDPTCFNVLNDLGLPREFLSSVVDGILPSSKAITCVPNGLGAICLNSKGLEAVTETAALRFLVDLFTDRKYVMAMNEGIVPLANAVEELLRHVSSLRGSGVDLIIEIINKTALLGDTKSTVSSEKHDGSDVMDMDSAESGDKENLGSCSQGAALDLSDPAISDEQCMQLSIFHVMVLVHRTMENSETCRLFVEKSGIEALLKLLLRPSITQSSEGMSLALHSTMVFKCFTQHHSTPLARAICSSLQNHLKETLTRISAVSGSFLLDSRTTPDPAIFSSLSLVEFLLFLAASKDSRWVMSLLTEFGNDSKDVLEDIGRIHRETLWQISLLEDTKSETDDESTVNFNASRQSELGLNDSEDIRLNSFRQFLDPLLRRRTSGWSFESQFFDLINLYRDLTRSSSLHQRQIIDTSSDSRVEATQEPHQSGGSYLTESGTRRDDSNQRSFRQSSCEMFRSLSVHVTHLFQELGKAMLLPSRRRDDLLNVSPPSKSVASTFASIAMDHMNFAGDVNSSASEASVSTKCRYFGKVIEFIDEILLDKPDSCNPIILNCFYGRGVIQSVLTTFEATSQLPFTISRNPASPMDTDEGRLNEVEEANHPWISGPSASYGKLMDHLVTSSFILSPFNKHLLTQPLVNGDIPFPRDAETFVKVLQSMVLKAVLPVWTHPRFPECSFEFITTVVSIFRHIFSGVEVKHVSSNVGRLAGPPPNEAAISTIVEMGFSRSRAEEALRQVGSNSVELAMEWLCSHSEETQEDDELARALAMSLGNSGSDAKEESANESSQAIEEELVQLPPVDELLSTCKRLLQMKDTLAFPVRDLLVLICSQNEGKERPGVISFIIEQLKLCNISDSGNQKLLSSFFHVLALVLNEDAATRELASKSGLVKVASDLLHHWSCSDDQESPQVPKWVTSAFIAVDRLAQVDTKLNADMLELLKKHITGNQSSLVIDEDKQDKMQMSVGTPSKYLDLEEQKRLIEIACGCIRKQLPSEATHAILQLCSTLTRTHSVAVAFLEAGGLQLLLSLPASSLFVGFDNVVAIIIRHILEDSQTLQQAMESEIRHSFVTAANRPSSGRLTARTFLSNLSSVVQRDPVTFMQAAKSVCQVEMVGERPYIILIKDRDKDKIKDKEKEKDKTEEKEKQTTNDGKLGNALALAPGTVPGKIPDANSKNSKTHRKPPQSFVSVIDLLLDSVISFTPPLDDESVVKVGSSPTDMEVDVSVNKDKGKAVASPSESIEANDHESLVSMAKVVFLLKLLTEILLMYASSVHILVRKDAEVCNYRGLPQRGGAPCCPGGIFHHFLYKFLPYSKNTRKEKKTEVDWRHKLATKANQFLVASCVRSTEARKRIFSEISSVFNGFVSSVDGFRAPRVEIQSLVDLLNDVLAARAPTGSYISAEASVTFIEVGLVQSLTRTLQVLDLDHTDSSKVVTGIVKVLELVTKEHVHAFENVNGRGDRVTKPTDSSRPREGNGGASQSLDAVTNVNENVIPSDQIESFHSVQNYGGSEAVTDDMEHDQDIDGGFAAAEDDYMQENAEDTQNRENGLDVGIRFEIGPATQGSLDEDEDDDEDDDGDADEMSGDDGDEVDEDVDDDADDEHNDIDEDEAHHLPHPDTDQDDHEIDEDEFDEEVMEEDDDEEDDDDGVIVRLGEGMNGVNVFDHIEVFGRDSISSEAFHVMPVEIFGSRRPGRTTSIYNLLGRNGDNTAPTQHPLLMEPSPLSAGPPRQPENDRDASHRNFEGSLQRLDSIFRSLRNGRQGHRFNLLANESQLSGGSNSSVIPQGFEDLLVSSLRRPSSEKSSNTSVAVESQPKNEDIPSSQFTEMPTDNQENGGGHVAPPSSATLVSSQTADRTAAANEPIQGTEASNRPPQSTEIQYDHSDVLRDVEAVSQESGGSGATLGESLRSLDVEIGSADGHDDGGDTRMRRVNPLFGNNSLVGGRDASLHSVTEVSEDAIREADQSGPPEEEQHNRDAESIDPAFLDALPEELRAEVLSAQPSEAPQSQNPEPQNSGDIDPEFLAALPPDIREEVLAQQRAQRMHQSQELEGQPVEMDTVSIIATFPSDIREEVLLTSSDAILANLTPALVAEANMLRERFARRYNQSLFGLYPRNRRGESSRRGGDGLDRVGGVLSRRSMGVKPVEAEGSPLVDTEGLRALIRLLRVVQPLYKNEQKLLLNLCAHAETRIDLLKILMDLLMWDIKRPRSNMNTAEAPYRLYACQSHVMYSRPQCVDGVPPLVSRRALETLTYLARNHPLVAKLLLEFKLPQIIIRESPYSDEKRGKNVMVHDESMSEKQECQEGQASLTLLLSLLNQSLYLRSIAHLEQLLNLLDVVIDNAEKRSYTSDRPMASPSQQPDPQVSTSDAEMNVVSASGEGTSTATASSPDADGHQSAQVVLNNLPKPELQLLCSLLALDGLSDNAYTLAAEVLRKLVAIAPIHCHLFITELSGSVRKLTKSATEELSIFGDIEKAVLSTSAHGAQVLRVLQALSSLVVLILDKDKKHQILPDMEHSSTISLVRDINAALEPLWQELSNCISKIESFSDVVPDQPSSSVKPSNSMPPLPAGTQNVLPYIESFFVTCEKLHPGQSGGGQDFSINAVSDVDESSGSVNQQKSLGPSLSMKVEEKHIAFVKFCERHRKLLNAFVRQNPGLLEKSFSLMLKVPRFIDFDNKRSHFRSKIKHQHDHHHSPLRISVRRAYILEDSYNQLRMRSAQDLKGRLTVHFQGEEGIDAGGLTREWYQLLSRVIFDKGALLFTTVGNESTFQPNPNSVYQTEHLSYFKFVGRVVGKALFDGQLLDVHFTRSFYKHILGIKVTYHDIEAIDPDYFKNLKWMLENDISDVLDLTFSIDADEEKLILYERAQVTDYELIPGGRNIKVTEENKHQYVDLVAEHRLTTAIRPQINAFMEGFNELIPRDLISIFHDKELELLISGLPDIDLDDLRANTEYSGYSAASPIIQWFWEVVQGLSKEDKARLLQFVTGTSKVPLEGFSALQGISGSQKFQIHKAYGSADHLPSAHTCFNQLDLPEYPSKERLEERLLLAIHEANEGFGFG